jgi:hypothetical protein
MNAKLAFTAISEIPLPGSRAAAISWYREAWTNALEAVPKAFRRRCHQSRARRVDRGWLVTFELARPLEKLESLKNLELALQAASIERGSAQFRYQR